MHVPEDVVFWFHPLLHRREQLDASGTHAGAAQVTVANGWRVRYEYVNVLRNLFPLIETRLATLHIEGPLAELGLPRCTVYPEPVQFDRFVLQVHAATQVLPDVLRFDRFGKAFLRVSQGRYFVQQGGARFLAAGTRILEWMGEGVVEA